MSPRRRICLDPPQRSNPTTPDASLLLAENENLSTREECVELCYRTDVFSDITFRVGEEGMGPVKEYKLHRLILAGQSPYLYELCVKASGNAESIELTDIQPYIFDHVVKWLYKSKLVDKTEDMAIVARIYGVASQLKIKDLESKCLDTLTQILEREKAKEQKGEVSILDEMLVKTNQTPEAKTKKTTERGDVSALTLDPSLFRSNTETTVSTYRRESKAKDFLKGVMDKVITQKDASKERGASRASTVTAGSLLNRAKAGLRGNRVASQPVRTSMISQPFGAARLVMVPRSLGPASLPTLPEAMNLATPLPGTGSPASAPPQDYRNSTAF
ncbi:hypothetical protein TWF730_003640 [Orbilia blumenaviensis]|uniref:BTB domain-containing protein n=1 Tax=Orbilia blumenaviensis TaxID=1796055 RepID=A0AAV9U3M2_9PEZI